jgi:hypothetical protein
MKKKLNLRNPKTFNEKIQWLKLHDRKPEYSKLVDKVTAKEIVGEIIGKEYIIPTLGVWNCFDEINFDLLPNQFVLKCTHDSGTILICKNKNLFNKKTAKRKLTKALKSNYYWMWREWPYKDVKPRIIAEEFLNDDVSDDLFDYKFMAFNEKVRSTFVCSNRNYKGNLNVTFFDLEWNRLPFERTYYQSPIEIEKPINYELMLKLTERLVKEIHSSFVRIDFYEVNGKIYFGEVTFFPGSGLESFQPVEWDYKFGEWLELPKKDKRN